MLFLALDCSLKYFGDKDADMRLRRFVGFPWLFLLILVSLFVSIPESSRSNPLHETLANGLQVFILENPGTTSVAVNLWVKVGSRYESK